jgi:hypothetical protein
MVKQWLIAPLALCASVMPASAATEYEVKAAFLYNFAKFVEWPPATFQTESDPIVLGIIGEDPFGNTIDTMFQNVTIQKHPLVVKRLQAPPESTCQILFISESEQERAKHILASLDEKPILTVSDIPDFIGIGGMIGFDIENSKVRFSINKNAADAAKLQFSSQVLKLASAVKATAHAKAN